jgi:hypothetical protein
MNQPHNPRCPLSGHRIRHDGWNTRRVDAFLRHLSITGCVRESAFMVGMSKTSAYRLQRRSPEFAIAWDEALSRAVFHHGLLRASRHAGRLV